MQQSSYPPSVATIASYPIPSPHPSGPVPSPYHAQQHQVPQQAYVHHPPPDPSNLSVSSPYGAGGPPAPIQMPRLPPQLQSPYHSMAPSTVPPPQQLGLQQQQLGLQQQQLGLQQQQSQISEVFHMVLPQEKPLFLEPMARARQLIQHDLRQVLAKLMNQAADSVKKLRPMVQEGEDEKTQQQRSTAEQQARFSQIHMQKALQHFYAICDQIEHQFTLMQTAQKHTRLAEKHLPPTVRVDEMPPPRDNSVSVTQSQYKTHAAKHVEFTNSVREQIAALIRQLDDDDGDQPMDDDSNFDLDPSSMIDDSSS